MNHVVNVPEAVFVAQEPSLLASIQEGPREIISPGEIHTEVEPDPEVDRDRPPADLNDAELLNVVKSKVDRLRDYLPYLREARDRFAKPGRRIKVEGEPSWIEWVESNLKISVRRVQQLLAEDRPGKPRPARAGKRRKTPTVPFSLPGVSETELARLNNALTQSSVGPVKFSRFVFSTGVNLAPPTIRPLVDALLELLPDSEQPQVLEELRRYIDEKIEANKVPTPQPAFFEVVNE